ncbi:IclR family transcriptional regulator [Roseomonas sp. BN140053]|uniref:IclR family transcriptional regulator n=1 Tax=Roseomonas sp. BN140053 TaxID=3391898 RepID=UPI0039ED2C06
MLRILDVLGENSAPLGFDALHGRLGFTRSTLYRYLKILTDAGLVASSPEAGFSIGPRITELDYRMRQHDPLITASRPVMAELAQATAGIALLCRRYGDRVLCVHQERGTNAFRSTYERGLARPLFRGAASRVILAHLPGPAIARLQTSQAEALAESGLPTALQPLRAALRAIRQRGWDVTEGQVTPGVTGIAAALSDSRGEVLGSLSVTLGRTGLSPDETARIAERVTFCAGIVNKTLAG